MAFISQNEINDIRNSLSIVDVISSYIPLNQKGKNFFGVCPFHEDHSPSMSVSQEKQIYKCFSCGATGNIFTFIENYLNVNFNEAVLILAEKAGLSLKGAYLSHKEKKFQDEFTIMELAMKFYQNNLNTSEGKEAIEYLKTRQLDETAIKDFEIGYALEKNMLYNLLRQKDYSPKTLEELGLITINSDTTYDTFQNRIMFPIHNLEGQVIGFTARSLLNNQTPKYLNTKETCIFKKGNILFNYHRAKDSIRLKKEVIIVEGNMDAIRLFSSGIKNVIALMGTSLTKEQIKALKKLRSKIILMLDNDNAGETATYNVGNILEENKLEISVVRLNGAKDPDEYILNYSQEALLENINNAVSFMDFKLNYLKKNKNLESSTDLAEYIKAVLENLQNSNDEILKEVTLQKISNDYNISYAVLKEQLKTENVKPSKDISREPIKKSSNNSDKLSSEILYCMMNNEDYIKLYQTRLGMFPDKLNRSIANEIIYYYETNKSINLADFITYAESTNLKSEIMDIIEKVNIEEVTLSIMEDLLKKLLKKQEEQKIKDLKKELKDELDINEKLKIAEKIAYIKKGSVENESYQNI